MSKFSLLIAVISIVAFSMFPAMAQEEESVTIADIVVASTEGEEPEFTFLLTAVLAADEAVLEALSDPEADWTVFAPTDAAFTALAEALGEEAFAEILADPEALTAVLLYHVLDGSYYAEDVTMVEEDDYFRTMNDDYFLTVSMEDEMVYINEAQVLVTDIEADNGVIHVIDAVLVPTEDYELPNIAEVVIELAGDEEEAEFTTLLAAVSAADPSVLEALSDDDAELTVFAPTDAAFAALIEALGEEAFGEILADTEMLTNILLYHVVAGEVYAEDVVMYDGEMVDTLLEGDPVAVTVDMGSVYIDGAEVLITDIETANGIIHVIDAVIVPDGE